MHAFIRLNSRDYFCSVVDNTASHAVDIDHFARSAENEATNRSRLDDLISEHLDHIHYLNDIFLVKVSFNVINLNVDFLAIFCSYPYLRMHFCRKCYPKWSSDDLLLHFICHL